MAKWVNNDGLIVKFGEDEGNTTKGGSLQPGADGVYRIVFDLSYLDAQSTTNTIVGANNTSTDGGLGIIVPKGARIKAIETIATTAFTSSGTIGTSTLVLGLKKLSDLSTELDHDGFTTTALVGSTFDAVGERNYITVGSTGAGALIGTTLAESGVVVAANSQHASHPYTAGVLRVSIEYFYV